MRLGKFELTVLSDGIFWLDGGAMFGVVPKVLWNKLTPADEQNRIKLGLNCLLIQVSGQVTRPTQGEIKNIIIDTGVGNKSDEKFKDMFSVDKSNDLISSLKAHNLKPEDINIVINTHLHFDHCGGNTCVIDNKLAPSFPKAKYIIQKGEWQDAINPNERTRASYLKENLIPIEKAGLLELIEGDTEILPGVKCVVTGGHTLGHQSVLIESEGKKAFYLGDLIPTTAHIKPAYIMGYDLYPIDTINKRKEVLDMAFNEQWLLVFEHDPKIGMGYLSKKEEKFIINPLP